MKLPEVLLAAALLAAGPALAGNAVSDNHPEDAYPNDAAPAVSPGPYADMIRQVQERLRALDFDPGPVNGEVNSKTQAALAQFQLSQLLPASGALDKQTLSELGMAPPVSPPEAPAAESG